MAAERHGREVRKLALGAAHKIVSERGARALTLNAVAVQLRCPRADLVQRFGSSAGLHAALGRHISQAVLEAMKAAGDGIGDLDRLVDAVFDAFALQGSPILAWWLTTSRHDPFVLRIGDAVARLIGRAVPAAGSEAIALASVAIMQAAIGDALIGDRLSPRLGLEREIVRSIATRHLAAILVTTGEA